VRLAVYQGMLRDKDGNLSSGGRLAAGFMAGTTEALLIVTPFEVRRRRRRRWRRGHGDGMQGPGPKPVCGRCVCGGGML